jgi:hypothetical protein
MTGEASWVTMTVLLAGLVFVLALWFAATSLRGLRRVGHTVHCPMLAREVGVVALQSEVSGRHTDVVRCDALSGPVTCDRACLAQLNTSARLGPQM